MPRAPPRGLARRGIEFHRQHEAALLVRLHGADAHDLAGDFLATVNERYDAGYYSEDQANELRNLIDVAIEVVQGSEVPA